MVQLLQKECPALAHFLIAQGDLTRIIHHWLDKDVMIIDAIQLADGKVGEIYRVSDITQLSVDYGKKYSSHSLSIAEVVELGRRIDREPKSAHFIGVQGANWTMGQPVSGEMKAVMPEVKQEVLKYFKA